VIFIIKHTSFNHGWFYHYRVHKQKLNELGNCFSNLKIYLKNMFEKCPHNYFEVGPRGSCLKFDLNLDVKEIIGHEVSLLTRVGLEKNEGRFTTNHSKVQVFMLENDDKTIAMEVPIWLEPNEIKDYNGLFNTNKQLTGHIDVLRIENDKIWVWDYKPNAKNEKYAITQTYFYALMLSKRTRINLDNFRCGYFDSEYAYVFKPEENILKNKQTKLKSIKWTL
jgi:hypothetical protein